MFNILVDELPKGLRIGDVDIPIRYDFKTWVRFELVMCDRSIDDDERLLYVLELIFDEDCFDFVISNVSETIERLIDFYSCCRDSKEIKTDEDTFGKGERIYSFKYDADLIFSAFLECYGIDLSVEFLHWFQFQALLSSLGDCKFTEVLKIRAIRIDSEMSDENKKYYREMKRVFALPDERSQVEKEDDFINALMI